MASKRTACLTANQLVILSYRAKNAPVAEIARRRGVSRIAVYRALARAAETIRSFQNEFRAAGLDEGQVEGMLLSSLT